MSTIDRFIPQTTEGNPFELLLEVLHRELFGKEPSDSLKRVVYFLLGILGLVLIGSLTALIVKVRRGERWLYKVHDLTEGKLIVPNITLNYLIYNSIFVPIAVAYVCLAGLKLNDNLHNLSWWMAFTFLTMFTGIWHVVWGSTASGIMQRARIVSKGKIVLPSFLVNGFFISGFVAAWVSMIATTGIAAAKWNKGFKTYTLIKDSALPLTVGFTGANTSSAVIEKIPTINEWLNELSNMLTKYENPYIVCAIFALISGVIMSVACAVQAYALRDQVKPTQSAFSASVNSAGSKASFRDPGLQRMLRNIIITTITICLSMFAYFAVCFVGNVTMHRSEILQISRSNMAHMIIIMFVYTTIDAISVSTILYTVFDPEAVARSASNAGTQNQTSTFRSEKRTIKSTKSWDFDSMNSSNGIEVAVEVKVDVDDFNRAV